MEIFIIIIIIICVCISVSRFDHPESRKSLIRLEQGARAYLNRAITSRGAFAVIYGLHLKYYIKDPEVNSTDVLLLIWSIAYNMIQLNCSRVWTNFCSISCAVQSMCSNFVLWIFIGRNNAHLLINSSLKFQSSCFCLIVQCWLDSSNSVLSRKMQPRLIILWLGLSFILTRWCLNLYEVHDGCTLCHTLTVWH
jgi:hypothetical protein